ncbi:hypothetical protein D046_3825A, partial [Vibrio parahaemolyticus V-223/04]
MNTQIARDIGFNRYTVCV